MNWIRLLWADSFRTILSITCMSKLKKPLIICLWLAFWQITAVLVHNSIMLVGPFEALRALWALLPSADFWRSVTGSFGRISTGFLAAFMAGVLLGSMAYTAPLLEETLEPLMLFLKAVPVASFVILALIWAGSHNLSVVISFLVVLPVVYVNTMAGLKSTDKKLLEMAAVFRMPLWRKIRFIYLPALVPHLVSGCRIALGMSWKSGAAAEVIGLPEHSIGEHLYMAKIYLETADLFAWTLVIILVSALFERIVLFLISRLCPQKGEVAHETTDP